VSNFVKLLNLKFHVILQFKLNQIKAPNQLTAIISLCSSTFFQDLNVY